MQLYRILEIKQNADPEGFDVSLRCKIILATRISRDINCNVTYLYLVGGTHLDPLTFLGKKVITFFINVVF